MKLDLTKPPSHTTSLPLPPPSSFLSTTALIPHYRPPLQPATKNPLQRSFFLWIQSKDLIFVIKLHSL